MRYSNKLGYGVLTFAQIAISINVITNKFLLTTMPMFMLLTCRFFISTLLLALVLKITRTPLRDIHHPQATLTKNDWLLMIFSGLFAGFLFNLFFVWGLQYTTATAAGIVGSTLPAIIALCALTMLKERLSLPTIMAIVLAVAGVLVINFDSFGEVISEEHNYFGDFLIFIAMIPEAWYSILSRKLANRVTPLGAAFIANLVGFVCLLLCALITQSFEIRALTLSETGFIFIGGLSALIFFWAWNWGLQFIPASTAGIFGAVMPIATTLLAIVFLDEHLHWYDIIGMLFVMASIGIGTGGDRLFALGKNRIRT